MFWRRKKQDGEGGGSAKGGPRIDLGKVSKQVNACHAMQSSALHPAHAYHVIRTPRALD
jgi:hypothetical protein